MSSMISKQALIKALWNCADNQYLEYAILRARLNDNEKKVLEYSLDRCYSQERTAEYMDISVRSLQTLWYSATKKLLSIPWVYQYAKALAEEDK